MRIKNKTKRNRNNLGEGGQKISHGDFSSAYSFFIPVLKLAVALLTIGNKKMINFCF